MMQVLGQAIEGTKGLDQQKVAEYSTEELRAHKLVKQYYLGA